MILNLYLTLLFLVICLFYLGFEVDSLFGIMAGFFLFVISICLLWTPLTYPTGVSQTTSYNYLNSTSGVINNTITTQNISYTSFSETIPKTSFTINTFIMFLSALAGFAVLYYFIINYGRKK